MHDAFDIIWYFRDYCFYSLMDTLFWQWLRERWSMIHPAR